MNPYQNILCPVAFSSSCELAAKRAAELAGRYQARLTLLHVIDHFPEDFLNEWIAPDNAEPEEYLRLQTRKKLASLAACVEMPEVEQVVRFTTFSVRHEIVLYAKEVGIDLVVIGSHTGQGLLSTLGSTAAAISHTAPCDTLLVRATG